jgi:hypothetical protein
MQITIASGQAGNAVSELPLSTPLQAKIKQFTNRQAHDTRVAHERWRRALLIHDQHAWQQIYADHQGQVRYWVKGRLRFPIDVMTLQTLVDDAFLKMAGTFTRQPAKFTDYPNLAALLGLLRLCAQRVVQDFVTSLHHTLPVVTLESIDEPIGAPEPLPSDLHTVLAGLLHDEQERLVVTKLFLEEMKPRQLYTEHPDLFQNVDEINTIRERVKVRLQRNDALRHYLFQTATE